MISALLASFREGSLRTTNSRALASSTALAAAIRSSSRVIFDLQSMLSTRTRGAKLTNETLAAIRKALEGAGVEFTNGKRPGARR